MAKIYGVWLIQGGSLENEESLFSALGEVEVEWMERIQRRQSIRAILCLPKRLCAFLSLYFFPDSDNPKSSRQIFSSKRPGPRGGYPAIN